MSRVAELSKGFAGRDGKRRENERTHERKGKQTLKSLSNDHDYEENEGVVQEVREDETKQMIPNTVEESQRISEIISTGY